MITSFVNRHRAAVAIAVSAVMLVVLAGLLPREYLANDDIGFTEYLRQDTYTPWISTILVRAFCFAYQQAPDVPWFGLYQYALIFITGAVLVHTCLELVDSRPGIGRALTIAGAIVLVASHAILVVGVTWTTVSISAMGTALAAFVAHVQTSEATKQPLSVPRAVLYGVLFVAGYMLRLQGLGAAGVAMAPLLGWAAIRCWRRRYLPKPTTVLAFIAPFAIVFVLQDSVANARGDDWVEFKHWTDERGKIHGHAAFEGLDTRAPELLKTAGWSVEEYRDFTSWLIIDEAQYPLDKIERLVATGGVPEVVTMKWSYQVLHNIFEDSSASVMLFIAVVVAGVVFAWRNLIDRRDGVLFSVGYLVWMIAVPVWMSAHLRFPQRVSLSFYSAAALGVFVYLARAIADRRSERTEPTPVDRVTIVGFAVIALFLLAWSRYLYGWLDRDVQPYRNERQALEDRVAARGGFVFIYVQHGLVEFDPLRARPRDYDGLEGGWGTFSFGWYEALEPLGVHRGSDALAAMVDNPKAYVMVHLAARDFIEDWIRRKLGRPSVRLALVDSAAIPGGGRPELYRVVTAPIVRDGEEWHAMQRRENDLAALAPGPPSVADLTFHPVPFAAPFDRIASPVRRLTANVQVQPIDDGIRCTVTETGAPADARDPGDGDERCATSDDDITERGAFAGVHIPVHGLAAARFELELIESNNIVGVHVYAQTATTRSIRWRWFLSAEARKFGFHGPVTLVPGYGAHQLALGTHTARPEDVRDLHVFVEVKPGTRAGFALRKLEIAEP